MVVIVKSPALKKRVFKQMNIYDKKALSEYKKGNIKTGKNWEKKSDKIYASNYSKIFKIVKK